MTPIQALLLIALIMNRMFFFFKNLNTNYIKHKKIRERYFSPIT